MLSLVPQRRARRRALVYLLLVSCAPPAVADEAFRFGAAVGAAGKVDGRQVHKFAVSAARPLPLPALLRPRAGAAWTLALRLRATLGAYRGDDSSETLLASLGPELSFGRAGLPVTLDVGTAPTFVGRDRFGGVDLGGRFQFTSHAGLTLALGNCCAISYRIEHVSNAGLESRNPGLDQHVVEFTLR